MCKPAALLTVVLTLAGAHVSYAQTCRGTAAIDASSPMQVGAEVSFAESTSSFGGTIAGGTTGYFAAGSFSRVGFDDVEESALSVAVSGGAQLSLSSDRRMMLCPLAQVGNMFGPNDVGGTGIDASVLTIAGGAAFGAIVADTGTLQVVPSVGVAVARLRATLDFAGNDQSQSETFGIVEAGLGLVFNERFSIVPRVSVPVSTDAAQTSFVLGFSVNFPR